MLIKIKNLRRQIYTVEIEPEKLVFDLKKAIYTECDSSLAIENQKLIYAGLILEDARTIDSYGIEDTKFIIMIAKPKELPCPVKDNATSALTESVNKKEKHCNSGSNSAGNLCMLAVDQLGTNRVAFSEFLRKQPEFLQLRTIVRKNPDHMFAALQLIVSANPDIIKVLEDNQETFFNFLNEADSSNTPTPTSANCTKSNYSCEAVADNLDDDISSDRAIVISEEDQAAIDRLLELGFPEHLVVQAYIACDRNEVLATNFLLFDFGD